MKNKKSVKIIFGVILIFLLAGSVIYISKQLSSNKDAKGISGYILANGVEPDLTPEELQELLQKEIDESKVVFSIYTEPVFEGKKGTIMFANPQHSAHNIDLNVEVNGRTVIKTGKIAPNQYIEEIEMLRSLKKGEHKGAALITAYKQDTDEVVGQVAVDLDITVN